MNDDEQVAMACPSCGHMGLKVQSMMYSIPFFNELAMFTMHCPECGFSHNDVFSPEDRGPMRWTLRVNEPDLLRARVVRSGSGTVRFPEFGIDIEPGPSAEAYISNVEGVLVRTQSVVETATRFADEEEEKEKGREILRMIDRAIEGNLEFTIVIEDPAGVSGILPEDMSKVKREEISQEEASKLRGGPTWIDTAREEFPERKG
ncbi:ZPR1 zinc finger domain-containing protein [Candidatus Thorarchaeota archaeon]|nr:MAG: ZPR1 zinc finger domain-containing protein [Candidatus Thorarchaeota archaeon]